MKKIRAFTLAEVLITLAVIGVVAALTIPSLMQNINDYTLQKQKDVSAKKFDEGLRKMRAEGKLAEYYNATIDFANTMKNNFIISLICDSSDIQNCFTPTFNASTSDGTASKNFDADKMTSATYLSTNLSDYDNPVGIKFPDGTSMVILYKKDCIGPSEGDTVEANLKKCIGYIFDVNGNKAPNKLNSDVVSNLPLIYPYNLSFEILNNKAYRYGDCETAPNGSNVCYDGNVQEFCEAIGGTDLTVDQLYQLLGTVYDEEIINMWNNNDLSNLPESLQINNSPLLSFIGCSSGKHVILNHSVNLFSTLEDGLIELGLQEGTLEDIDVVLCTTK